MNETELRKRWRAELNGCELIEAMTPNIIVAIECAWFNCLHNGGPDGRKPKAQYWEGKAQGIIEALRMFGLTDEELDDIVKIVNRDVALRREREEAEE